MRDDTVIPLSAADEAFEALLRERLHDLAHHAPTTVRQIDETRLRNGERHHRGRRLLGAAASVAVLAGAGTLAFVVSGRNDVAGAASPDEAVAALVTALENEDLLGAIDVLDPAEVPALRAALDQVRDGAAQTGLIADELSLERVQGVEIDFADLSLTSEQLAPDLVVLTPASGSVSARFDPAAFPFGAEVAAVVGPDSQPVDAAGELGVDLADLHIATVQRDGRWFVSVQYSIAEQARRSAGMELPDGPLLEAVGAESPEALAQAALSAFVGGGDAASVAQLFAPGEGDVMRRYPLEWLRNLLGSSQNEGGTASLSELEVRVEGEGDRVRIVPTSFTVVGTIDPSLIGPIDVFDPSRPTLVMLSTDDPLGEAYVWLPAGVPVPDTVDALAGNEVLTTYPEELLSAADYFVNFANEMPDGTIYRAPDATPAPAGPIAYRSEVSDGCTTVTGDGLADVLGMTMGGDIEQVSDDSWRYCPEVSIPGALSVLVDFSPVWSQGLPTLGAVEVGDRWFLSPAGTAAAWAGELVTPRSGGSGVFDSFVGGAVYGFDRVTLSSWTRGLPIDQVIPECAPLLEVGADGTADGMVATPDPAQLRTCGDAYEANGWDFLTGSGQWEMYDDTTEVLVPETTLVP